MKTITTIAICLQGDCCPSGDRASAVRRGDGAGCEGPVRRCEGPVRWAERPSNSPSDRRTFVPHRRTVAPSLLRTADFQNLVVRSETQHLRSDGAACDGPVRRCEGPVRWAERPSNSPSDRRTFVLHRRTIAPSLLRTAPSPPRSFGPLAVQNVVGLGPHEGDQNRFGYHAAPLASAAAAICRRRSGVAAGNPK